MSRFPALPARRPGRLLPLALGLALVAAAGCSEKPKAPPKAKEQASKAASPNEGKPAKCPIQEGKAASAQGVGGLAPGQDLKVVRANCQVTQAQSGPVPTALSYATQALWLMAGSDTVRVLAGDDGKVIEVDALTSGFRTPDSLHVGSTLGDILQRRPAAARDGGLEILAGQLVVPPGGRCGLYLVLKEGLQGQQISLAPAEIAKQPRSLRVKRLALLGGCGTGG